MRSKILPVFVLCLISIFLSQSITSYAQSSENFQLKSWSISSTAGNLASNNLQLKGSTLGGFAIGMSSSNRFILNGGLAITAVNDTSMISSTMPNLFKLMQNYPNPFNPLTTIRYILPERMKVSIVIYNSLGQKVRKMDQDYQSAGEHFVVWDAKNEQGQIVPSGVYYYQISAAGFLDVKKMLFIK